MKIERGTQIYIGAPAKPLPALFLAQLGAALGKLSAVIEAHLPQMYVPGKIDPSAQVLVFVLKDGLTSPRPAIQQVLKELLPTGTFLDVMECRPNDPLLPTVRTCHCELDLKRSPIPNLGK